MRRLLIILFSITALSFAYSQSGARIYVSKTYTEFGEPVGRIQDNKAETEKTYSILLSGTKKFTQHIVFLHIEKRGDKNPYSQFSKLLRTDKNKSFLAFNYTFYNEGVYDIYFTDFAKHKLASATITVIAKSGPKPEKSVIGELKSEIEVSFCKKIISELPIDKVNSVSISGDGGEIYIYLASGKQLGTNKLLINIWKRKSDGNYDEFVDSKKFQIDPEWLDTYFKYRFESAGDFKINFYDENEILLKTAYILVVK